MSQPGWYPDPAGSPGHFRYWNGTSWSHETTTTPASSLAPGGTPSGPTPVPPKRSRSGLILAIVGVLVLALGIFWFLNRGTNQPAAQEDTNTSKPTVSAWNETSHPSPSASEQPTSSGASLVDCPVLPNVTLPHPQDGRLHGGHVSVEQLPDPWHPGGGVNWAVDQAAQYLEITKGWVSNNSVGALVRAEGFAKPQQAASAFMSCYATSSFYRGLIGRKDLDSQAVSVDGHPGWYLRSEVRVNYPLYPQIEGDVVDIVVVDTGDPTYLSFWLGNATIGDAPVQATIDTVRGTLQVDS